MENPNPKDIEEKKENFCKCLQDAIKASLTFLKKEYIPQKFLDTLDISIDRKTKQFFIVHKKSQFPSFENFVEIKLNEILNLQEVKSCIEFCIEFMVKNHFYEKLDIKEDDENKENILKNILRNEIINFFLLKYSINKGFDYDENTFNKIYNELEEYINTEGLEMRVVVPLLNFELEGSKMVNLENFTIRELSDEEIKILLRSRVFGEHIYFPNGGSLDTIWCIELMNKIPSKRSIILFDSPTPSLLEKILTILRLFKDGSLQYSVVLTYPKMWFSYFNGYIYNPTYHGQVVSSRFYYKLTKDDIEKLKLFWNKFKNFNIENSSSINVAIRNFNLSYDLKITEDKLLHYITALESLFVRENDELSYRLALRCAYFLGKNKEERDKIFNILKTVYEIRSKVVHGVSKDLKEYIKKIPEEYNIHSLPDLLNQIEKYVRESLKLFIEKVTEKAPEKATEKEIEIIHREIIKEVDSKIIAGF